MEKTQIETKRFQETTQEAADVELQQLQALELALVGGGTGDVQF